MQDLPGTFEQLVLLAVLGLEQEAYGRSVLRSMTAAIEYGSVTAGAVYTTLDRLEEKGWLRSRLQAGAAERSGRPRRFYLVTASGLKALRDFRTVYHRIAKNTKFSAEVLA